MTVNRRFILDNHCHIGALAVCVVSRAILRMEDADGLENTNTPNSRTQTLLRFYDGENGKIHGKEMNAARRGCEQFRL